MLGPVRRASGRSLRMHSLILLGMLPPVLGLAFLAGSSVAARQSERDLSEQLRDAALAMQPGVEFRAGVATEEVGSTVLGLAHDLGVDPDDTDQIDGPQLRRDLAASRATVDAGRRKRTTPDVEAELDRLDGLREELDAGRAGNRLVSEIFADLNASLARQWDADLAEIEHIADEQPLGGELRARLRTLRYSTEAFTLGGPRVNLALDILLDAATPERTERLIALHERFHRSVEQAAPPTGTASARAWAAFAADGAARRTEAILDTAVAVGLGQLPERDDLQLGLVASGLADGQRWGVLLTDVVGAATRDLSAAADRNADDAAERLQQEILLTAGLIVVSGLVGLVTARSLTRPARDLQRAAQRVGAGDFEAEPIPMRGPAEMRETVIAFNDMAATLAAVEDQAVALADDPTSDVLNDPLPGRTGHALQQAIDQLRQSVHQAEDHRAELLELATHDGLTGLLNRAAAFTAIQQDLSRARRDGTQLLAFYVDLDGLKTLNDTYGHDVGDDAIARTADALRQTTRVSDIVARLGGDEFMVVGRVPEGGRDEIAAFAERIRAAVALQSVPVRAGHSVPLRCSVGIALSGAGTESAEALIGASDQALYRAKHSGRDQVAWVHGGRHGEG
ncbi:MAG: diguanylate cyclase [Acidimicrobiia bacterium]